METLQQTMVEGRLQELLTRGKVLQAAIDALPAATLTIDCRRRLHKVLRREMDFISSLIVGTLEPTAARLNSTNLIHLEAIIKALQHPLICGATALMQRVASPAEARDSTASPSHAPPVSALPGPADTSHTPSTPYPLEAHAGSPSSHEKDKILSVEEDPVVPALSSASSRSVTLESRKELTIISSRVDSVPMCTSPVDAGMESNAHVDIVCIFDGRPVWIMVTGRKGTSLRYEGMGNSKTKPYRARIQQLLAAATTCQLGSRPHFLLLWFASSLQKDMEVRLASDFGAGPVVEPFLDHSWTAEGQAQASAHGSLAAYTEVSTAREASVTKGGSNTEHDPDDVHLIDVEDDWVLLDQRKADRQHEECTLSSAAEVAAGMASAGDVGASGVQTNRGWTDGVWLMVPIPLGGATACASAFASSGGNLLKASQGTPARPRFSAAPASTCLDPSSDGLIQDVKGELGKHSETCMGIEQSAEPGTAETAPLQGRRDVLISNSNTAGTSPSLVIPNRLDCPDYSQPSDPHKEPLTLPAGTIHLDTTALVALVSEISNGGATALASLSNEEMQRRFRTTWKFMADQVASELQHPLQPELETVLSGRRPVVCESVLREFTNIVALIAGAREKQRAAAVLSRIRSVPDEPSARVLALPETGRIKARHKIAAGTADTWHAPMLTANTAFVRAARQAGVPLAIVEHRPRALTGD